MDRATLIVLWPVLATVVCCIACTESASPEGPGEGLPAADLALILEHTSDYQREFLADGSVSPAEYEASMLATVQCLQDAGFAASLLRQGQTFRIEGGPVATLDETLEWRDRYAQCEEEFSRDVQSVFGFQNRLSEEERLERRRKFMECVNERGIGIDDYDLLWERRLTGDLSESENRAVTDCDIIASGAAGNVS